MGWGRSRATVDSVEGKRKEMAIDLKLTSQGWQIKRPTGKYSLGVPGQINPKDGQAHGGAVRLTARKAGFLS
jgi:hypothetical protein